MGQSYPNKSLEELCALFGMSRQAYYQAIIHQNNASMEEAIILKLVNGIRMELRGKTGVRKLLIFLSSQLQSHALG